MNVYTFINETKSRPWFIAYSIEDAELLLMSDCLKHGLRFRDYKLFSISKCDLIAEERVL